MLILYTPSFSFFFFNDPATTEIYTLSLHDALPISMPVREWRTGVFCCSCHYLITAILSCPNRRRAGPWNPRSEEHTSELQSQSNLVCRLLLEKKKKNKYNNIEKYKKRATHI